MLQEASLTRRQVIRSTACGIAGAAAGVLIRELRAQATAPTGDAVAESIIDIHQHTTYSGRPDEALLHHQKRLGATYTILLPGGTPVFTETTHKGRSNGLLAGAGTFDTCLPIARAHPKAYFLGANEVPDLPETRQRLEQQLKQGAVCIGEQKFNLPVESEAMETVYEIAQAHDVPVLLHFQHEMFNTGYERFWKILRKWPRVNFIGHAQTFWGNIDAGHVTQQNVLYPKGKVTRGGWTDRYLSDYPNMFADLSAGSGLNAFIRDEDHARGFIERHQDKLLYGSDCSDRVGFGPRCTGASMIAAIRRLSPSKAVERKLLFGNASKLFDIGRRE